MGRSHRTTVLCFRACDAITSRQNPLVARFRAAARGERRGSLLLDGAHLVGEALDAGVAHARRGRSRRRRWSDGRSQALVAALERRRASRSTLGLRAGDGGGQPGAIAERDRRARRAARRRRRRVSTRHGAAGRRRRATCRIPAISARSCAWPKPAARPASSPPARRADPFGWKALRGSMGSALRLPIVVDRDGRRGGRRRAPSRLPRSWRPCRAAAGRSFEARSDAARSRSSIGGEGAGLAERSIDAADERVTIPMQPPVESLNAAVSGGADRLRGAAAAARDWRESVERRTPAQTQ